jgi:hypothetical protein
MEYNKITYMSALVHTYPNLSEYVRSKYGDGGFGNSYSPSKLEVNLCKGLGKPLVKCTYKEIKEYVIDNYTYTWWNRIRVFLHKSNRFLILKDMDIDSIMEYQAYHTKRVDLVTKVTAILKELKKDPESLQPYIDKLRADPAIFDYLMTGDVAHCSTNNYKDKTGIVTISDLPRILKERKCVRGNKKLLKVISHLKELLRANIKVKDLSVTTMELIVEWDDRSKGLRGTAIHNVNARDSRPRIRSGGAGRSERMQVVLNLLEEGKLNNSEIERLTGMTRKYIRKYREKVESKRTHLKRS